MVGEFDSLTSDLVEPCVKELTCGRSVFYSMEGAYLHPDECGNWVVTDTIWAFSSMCRRVYTCRISTDRLQLRPGHHTAIRYSTSNSTILACALIYIQINCSRPKVNRADVLTWNTSKNIENKSRGASRPFRTQEYSLFWIFDGNSVRALF